ncbi:MAG: ABC transporter ATP-binding protein [Caldilineaceae bacterium]
MNPIYVLWRLARFRPGLYLLQTSLYLGYTLSLAFSGLILRAFFDGLAGEPGAWALALIILLQLGNTLLAMVGLGGANAIGFYNYRQSTQALFLSNVFGRILERPGAQPLPTTTGSGDAMSVGVVLNTLRDDVAQIFTFALDWEDLFAFGLTAIIAFIAMVQVSISVTLGVFLPMVAIIVIANRLRSRIERNRVASRTATSHATGAIGEIFGAVQAIQVNNAEERIMAHFHRLNEARRRVSVQDQLLTRLVDALAGNMVVIGTALVLILAARAMQAGRFTVGDFALFVTYIWPITELFRNMGGLLAGYQQTGVSIRRLQALMQGAPAAQLTAPTPIDLTGPLPAMPAVVKTPADELIVLEARDLTYRYPGSDQGITGIDLRLARGTVTVITGPIGAGKTTLLRVLLGLLPKERGEIFWNGQLVTDPAAFMVPPRVAYTPQTPRLFSESLRDNILLGVAADAQWLAKAVDQAVLVPDIAAMDQGLDTLIGPRGMRLSGGQVQRAAAARMFVRAQGSLAELLVFDDLSSALDLETERLLWERLLLAPITCLVVSHRPSVLQRADQVIVLKEGRIEHHNHQNSSAPSF